MPPSWVSVQSAPQDSFSGPSGGAEDTRYGSATSKKEVAQSSKLTHSILPIFSIFSFQLAAVLA
jgi:hypothetical protein